MRILINPFLASKKVPEIFRCCLARAANALQGLPLGRRGRTHRAQLRLTNAIGRQQGCARQQLQLGRSILGASTTLTVAMQFAPLTISGIDLNATRLILP